MMKEEKIKEKSSECISGSFIKTPLLKISEARRKTSAKKPPFP